MSDNNSGNYRVKRPAKVQSDGQGRSVWVDTVEISELELVSTLALKKILTSKDEQSREAIKQAAAQESDGVLARDPKSGAFEIIDDDELQAILDKNTDLPPVSRPIDVTLVPLSSSNEEAADELSLVSTMALRKVLGLEEDEEKPQANTTLKEPGGGFDPYNSN